MFFIFFSLEQLCFVLDVKENDKIAELEMLLNANLSTVIDEEDDQITVFHRFVFDCKLGNHV